MMLIWSAQFRQELYDYAAASAKLLRQKLHVLVHINNAALSVERITLNHKNQISKISNFQELLTMTLTTFDNDNNSVLN